MRKNYRKYLKKTFERIVKDILIIRKIEIINKRIKIIYKVLHTNKKIECLLDESESKKLLRLAEILTERKIQWK